MTQKPQNGRKVIQIAIAAASEGDSGAVSSEWAALALCDDGTIWIHDCFGVSRWERFGEPPAADK